MTQRTITELTVLAMLGHFARHEVSGYDLKKFADDSLGYLWAPSKTQVYAVLPRLVADGLVAVRDVRQSHRPNKQLYRITRAGRAVVRDWLECDDDQDDPDRSMFMLKFFFGRQAAPAAMLHQLDAFRASYVRRLAVYEEIESSAGAPTRDSYTYLALQYGIARARAAADWAEAAAHELRRAKSGALG
jgi:DNA-binding PadR family transcriptional regulator